MKKILAKTLPGLLLLSTLAFVCCDSTISGDTEMLTETFTVDERDWEWNDEYRRYEYVFSDFYALDEATYWYGSVSAGVFMTETSHDNQGPFEYQVLRNLPFVHSYMDGVPYTETIGFDISAPSGPYPGSIMFYIQASDLSRTDDYLTDYTFKVTLFRDEVY